MTTNAVHPRPNKYYNAKDATRKRAFPDATVLPIHLPRGVSAETLFRATIIQTLPTGNEEHAWRSCLEAEGFTYLPGVGARLDIAHPDGRPSRTAFTAHMDDVSGEVTTIDIGTFIETTAAPNRRDTDTVLQNLKQQIIGADCRAGVAVLLSMLRRKVPGRYLIFEAEEVGLIGSRASIAHGWHEGLDRTVSFDRSGTEEIITHMHGGSQTASDAFAEALAEQLSAGGVHLRPSHRGSSTDAWAYKNAVPECVNISVGYDGAHTVYESQNVSYLNRLARACAAVTWDTLPVARDPRLLRRRTVSFGQLTDGQPGPDLLWTWERHAQPGTNPSLLPNSVDDLIYTLQTSADAPELSHELYSVAVGSLLDRLRAEHPEWLTQTIRSLQAQAADNAAARTPSDLEESEEDEDHITQTE